MCELENFATRTKGKGELRGYHGITVVFEGEERREKGNCSIQNCKRKKKVQP